MSCQTATSGTIPAPYLAVVYAACMRY